MLRVAKNSFVKLGRHTAMLQSRNFRKHIQNTSSVVTLQIALCLPKWSTQLWKKMFQESLCNMITVLCPFELVTVPYTATHISSWTRVPHALFWTMRNQNHTCRQQRNKILIAFFLAFLQRGLSLWNRSYPTLPHNPLPESEDTCYPKASGLPCGYVSISDEPVYQLFSHNAVGMCPQPVAMVLELHPTIVMADFLPQIFQLDWVLDREIHKLLSSQTAALVSRASVWVLKLSIKHPLETGTKI